MPHSIAGIILAAGMSKRLGSTKQLLKMNGKYLLQWIVDAAIKSELNKIFIVLGSDYRHIIEKLPSLTKDPKIEVLYNPEYESGMSSSVKCGLSKAKTKYTAVMFLLGDQPFISTRTINRMVKEFFQTSKGICVPVCEGRNRNPVIFSSLFYEDLLNLSGDVGGRGVIYNNSKNVLFIHMDTPQAFFDLDTPEDIHEIRSKFNMEVTEDGGVSSQHPPDDRFGKTVP